MVGSLLVRSTLECRQLVSGAVSLEEFTVLMADTPSSTAVATASNDQLVGVGGNSYTRAWMAEVESPASNMDLNSYQSGYV